MRNQEKEKRRGNSSSSSSFRQASFFIKVCKVAPVLCACAHTAALLAAIYSEDDEALPSFPLHRSRMDADGTAEGRNEEKKRAPTGGRAR